LESLALRLADAWCIDAKCIGSYFNFNNLVLLNGKPFEKDPKSNIGF